jgi:hypothetical protein
VLDAECAKQYLRLCSETLLHWLLAAPNSQRHTPHEQESRRQTPVPITAVLRR